VTPNDSGNGASNAMQRKGCNAVCNTVTNARETLAIPSPTPPALPPQPYPPQCRYSPVHHGVQLVTRASAPIVAPSPVTTPDAMMSLTAIEHLDFRPTCEDKTGNDEPADYIVETAQWVLKGLPDVSPTWCICRTHFDEAIRIGLEYTPFLPPPLRIVQVLR